MSHTGFVLPKRGKAHKNRTLKFEKHKTNLCDHQVL